jgi:hypothetical protein
VGGKGSGRKRLSPEQHRRRGTWRADRHGVWAPSQPGPRPSLHSYSGLCVAWEGLPDHAQHMVTQVVERYPSLNWEDYDDIRRFALAADALKQLERAKAPAADIERAQHNRRVAWLALRDAHHARLAALRGEE